VWSIELFHAGAADRATVPLTRIGPPLYERAMLMMMVRRLGSGAAVFVCLAIALWAMWTMLGAAFDSDWLEVARTLMLWTAAVGTTHLCLVPPNGG
jgi:hypothetical protein